MRATCPQSQIPTSFDLRPCGMFFQDFWTQRATANGPRWPCANCHRVPTQVPHWDCLSAGGRPRLYVSPPTRQQNVRSPCVRLPPRVFAGNKVAAGEGTKEEAAAKAAAEQTGVRSVPCGTTLMLPMSSGRLAEPPLPLCKQTASLSNPHFLGVVMRTFFGTWPNPSGIEMHPLNSISPLKTHAHLCRICSRALGKQEDEATDPTFERFAVDSHLSRYTRQQRYRDLSCCHLHWAREP